MDDHKGCALLRLEARKLAVAGDIVTIGSVFSNKMTVSPAIGDPRVRSPLRAPPPPLLEAFGVGCGWGQVELRSGCGDEFFAAGVCLEGLRCCCDGAVACTCFVEVCTALGEGDCVFGEANGERDGFAHGVFVV